MDAHNEYLPAASERCVVAGRRPTIQVMIM